jgi:hypothetical protein
MIEKILDLDNPLVIILSVVVGFIILIVILTAVTLPLNYFLDEKQ